MDKIKMVMLDTNDLASGVKREMINDLFNGVYSPDTGSYFERTWDAIMLTSKLALIHCASGYEAREPSMRRVYYKKEGSAPDWVETNKPVFFLQVDQYAAMPMSEDVLQQVYDRIDFHKQIQAFNRQVDQMEGR